MPRFQTANWLCAAGALMFASVASAQMDRKPITSVLVGQPQPVSQHPLVRGAVTPTPLPVTMEGGSPYGAERHEASADDKTDSTPSVLPQQVNDTTEYVDQNEGALRRLIRYYKYMTGPNFCYCQNYVRGQWSLSFMGGYLQTPFNWFGIRLGAAGPRLDFLPLNLRLSRIIRGNDGDRRLFKGATELVVEFTNMPIVFGPGDFLMGGVVSVRHNFSYTRKRMIPYVQFGGGAVYQNSWVGGAGATNLLNGFNFAIHTGVGSKFWLNNSWTFDSETAFYHFWNGGIIPANVGVNGIAGLFGLTYHFNRR